MNGKYEDIVRFPYCGKSTGKRMPMTDRAAQFSPFAALTGYDATIQETSRQTDSFIELTSEERSVLNEKLRFLAACDEQYPQITVICFLPDSHKPGGAYVNMTGNLKKLDFFQQVLFLMDGSQIPFYAIRELWSDLFLQLEATSC